MGDYHADVDKCVLIGELVHWHNYMGLWDTLIVWGKNHFQHLISEIGGIKFPGKFNEIIKPYVLPTTIF